MLAGEPAGGLTRGDVGAKVVCYLLGKQLRTAAVDPAGPVFERHVIMVGDR
jgi:hypothetical protein